MEKSDNNELEKRCFNCNGFFPDSIVDATEFGICLNDKIFEPYIDEILNGDFSKCQDLVTKNIFNGGEHCCDNFDPVEACGEDLAVDEFMDQNGNFNPEKFKNHIAIASMGDNISCTPVEQIVQELQNKSTATSASRTLSFLAGGGNEAAKAALLKYFVALPCPDTLEAVHHKIEAFELLQRANIDERDIFPFLIEEMKVLPSNNTTRQWYSAMLKYFSRCESSEVKAALAALNRKQNFSPKLRKRIEDIIEPPSRDSWW